MADAMEELCEKLEEHLTVAPPAPVVKVEAPTINVEAKSTPPVINVAAAPASKHSWTFTVSRDGDGRIQSMTATPS